MLNIRKFFSAAFAAGALMLAGCSAQPADPMSAAPAGDGAVKVKSVYSVEETVARLKQDIVAKGIMFFDQIDQSQLASTPISNFVPQRC